ncbi:hypothetical protein BS78_03G218700 [Paspalum vaginatum]|nr:hypothetical protein BS78_03G218700 [Paspalum vaginatum]
MAEYANKRRRGAFLAAVYAMQGVSILLGNAVALPVSAVMPEADYVWRAILMAGAAPAALAFCLRLKLPETARYTALVARDLRSAAADMSRVLRCSSIQEQELDVSVSGVDDKWGLFSRQSILQKDLLGKLGWVSPSPVATMDSIEEVSRLARAQALIALCSAIPGYCFAIALIDVLGRRRLQVAGFLAMTLSMLALAALYEHWAWHVAGFMALYNVAFFFANVGLPTPRRSSRPLSSSRRGSIAAAVGRAGVVLGAFGCYPKKGADSEYEAGIGTRNELFVLAGTHFLGMLMSLFVPETRGASLEPRDAVQGSRLRSQ